MILGFDFVEVVTRFLGPANFGWGIFVFLGSIWIHILSFVLPSMSRGLFDTIGAHLRFRIFVLEILLFCVTHNLESKEYQIDPVRLDRIRICSTRSLSCNTPDIEGNGSWETSHTSKYSTFLILWILSFDSSLNGLYS